MISHSASVTAGVYRAKGAEHDSESVASKIDSDTGGSLAEEIIEELNNF